MIFTKCFALFCLLSFSLNWNLPEDQDVIYGVHSGASQCLARSEYWTDVSGTTECIGLRIVLSTPSSEWGAGPECGAGLRPSSSCVQASLVVPLCVSLSCDLPKHPAPTPTYFPTQSLGGMVFGLFHISDYPRDISPLVRRIKSLTF